MKTKQIPFSLEIVKKIQAGEVKGIIKTRDGRAARFICEIRNKDYPLLFIYSNGQKEWAYHYTIDGFYHLTGEYAKYDIILEIEDEQKKPEHQFKPFDKVLVRDEENGSRVWQAAFYSHFYIGRDNGYHVTTAGDFYLDGGIIPYEGNEHLVGTTDKPKED